MAESEDELKVVFCLGGNRDSAFTVWALGMLPGLRSDYKWYSKERPYLLDYPFHKQAQWVSHVRMAEKVNPILAMIPDIFTSADMKALELRCMELAPLCERLIITPKMHGIIADFPHDAIIGVSVPTGYAGFLPRVEDVIGRDLHLLGGSPDQQLYLKQVYKKSQVVSADGNIMHFKAGYGQFWTQSGKWTQTAPKQVSTSALLRYSAKSILKYLSCENAPMRKSKTDEIDRILNC